MGKVAEKTKKWEEEGDVQSLIASVKELLEELQSGKLTQKAQLLIGEIWESLDRIGYKDG